MPVFPTRLSDVHVLEPGADPLTGLSSIEIQIPLPTAAFTNRFIDSSLVEVPGRLKTLVIVVDQAITSGSAQQATVQLFAARTRYGTLGGDTAVTPGGTYGVTQPLNPFLATQGAASQFPTSGPNACQALGPGTTSPPPAVQFPFATSTASIPVGVYWYSATAPGNPSAAPPTSMTELVQMYPVLGIEITAPATFTGGLARAFFQMAPL